FGGVPAGWDPESELIQGSDGALYGTTEYGGDAGLGTVFKLNKDGNGFAVLRSFSGVGEEGKLLTAGLAQGSDGKLYGTALAGGRGGAGTIFRLNKDGSGYAVLHSFPVAPADGWHPGGLAEGSDGVLYGTTYDGGSSD